MNMPYLTNRKSILDKKSEWAVTMERERREDREGEIDQGQGQAETRKQRYEVPSNGLSKHKGKSSVRENNK